MRGEGRTPQFHAGDVPLPSPLPYVVETLPCPPSRCVIKCHGHAHGGNPQVPGRRDDRVAAERRVRQGPSPLLETPRRDGDGLDSASAWPRSDLALLQEELPGGGLQQAEEEGRRHPGDVPPLATVPHVHGPDRKALPDVAAHARQNQLLALMAIRAETRAVPGRE